MAYATAGLVLLVPGVGSGPAVWYYKSDDAHGDVDAAGYFDDATERGLKDNDIVIVVDEDTGTTTLHHVSGVSSGAATLAAATLS